MLLSSICLVPRLDPPGTQVVLEEFGKVGGQHSAYFQAAYQAVVDSLRAGGPLKGALYWQNYVPGQTDPAAGGVGKFGVLSSDQAFAVAAANAATVRKLAGSAGRCSKKAPGVTVCAKEGCARSDQRGRGVGGTWCS